MKWMIPLLGLALAGPVWADERTEARRVAARIDELIAAGYSKAGVQPAPLADDATFLRRAALDITGKIPAVHEVRKFLADRSAEKRAEVIDRLVNSPGYVNHFTGLWLELLIPEGKADFQKRFILPGTYYWLRQHFTANTPYDQWVRELVSLPVGANPRSQIFYNPNVMAPPNPIGFYQAKQGKSEEIAASISRLFLGVRLECAQCHDHPFGKWKREEFWSQAAFFSGFRSVEQIFAPLTEPNDRREITIPNTDRVVQARFLDGKMPRWRFKTSARTTLAEWMTTRDNPFFARAMVNRMWAHFFGIGLVDPVDDLVDDNEPSHPELLDYLAREFAEHNFDLKFLIRALTLSRAYQLSSVSSDKDQTDPRLFARTAVKGLSAEQLHDSLAMAAGMRDNTTWIQRLNQFGSARQAFLERFSDQERRTETYTSITQALTMMNSQLITEAVSLDRGAVLGAVVTGPFASNAERLETLFLAALSRPPRPEEAERFLRYIERGGATGQRNQAFSDVYWALLNSTEFRFNH